MPLRLARSVGTPVLFEVKDCEAISGESPNNNADHRHAAAAETGPVIYCIEVGSYAEAE